MCRRLAIYVSRKEKSYSPLGAMHVSDSHNLKESVVTTRQVDRSQRVFLERYCGYFREFGCFPLDLVALGCRQIDVFCAGGLTAFEADLTEIFQSILRCRGWGLERTGRFEKERGASL